MRINKALRPLFYIIIITPLLCVSITIVQGQTIDILKKENALTEKLFNQMKGKNQNPYRTKNILLWPNYESTFEDLQTGNLYCLLNDSTYTYSKIGFSEVDIIKLRNTLQSESKSEKWPRQIIKEVRSFLKKRSKAVRIEIGAPIFLGNFNIAIVYEKTRFTGNLLVYRWEESLGWKLNCSHSLSVF